MSGFTFNYHAGALALGGTRKVNGLTHIIPSVAQAELSPAGGEGSTVVYNYSKDDISFSHARSTVVGRSDSAYRTFTTTTEVYITDLNVFGRIKAAILHTLVTSTRIVNNPIDVLGEGQPDRSTFSVHAMIRDLVIDGVDVVPQYDFDLLTCGTYDSFARTLRSPGPGVDYEARFDIPQGQLLPMLNDKRTIRASFYNDPGCPQQTGNVRRAERGVKVKVGGLGHVHVGELLVNPGHRRVNLLRLKLDSTLDLDAPAEAPNVRDASDAPDAPESNELMMRNTGLPSGHSDEGEMAFVTVDGNGTPSWP